MRMYENTTFFQMQINFSRLAQDKKIPPNLFKVFRERIGPRLRIKRKIEINFHLATKISLIPKSASHIRN